MNIQMPPETTDRKVAVETNPLRGCQKLGGSVASSVCVCTPFVYLTQTTQQNMMDTNNRTSTFSLKSIRFAISNMSKNCRRVSINTQFHYDRGRRPSESSLKYEDFLNLSDPTQPTDRPGRLMSFEQSYDGQMVFAI